MFHDLLQDAFPGNRRKRRLPRQEVIEHATEAVNIGADVHIVRAAGLFRGQILGRAEQRPFRRQLRIGIRFLRVFVERRTAQADVENFHHRVQRRLTGSGLGRGHEDDVGRFQIAVDHPLLEHVLKSEQRLMNEPNRFRRQQALTAIEDFIERLAFQIFHHDEMLAVGFADLERPDDIGMIEFRQQPPFALKARQNHRLLGLRRRQHLERDELARRVHRLVDAGHAPFADQIEDRVLIEEEALRMASQQQMRLVLGQHLARDEILAEGLGLGVGIALRRFLPTAVSILDFIRRFQLAARDQRAILFHGLRTGWHGNILQTRDGNPRVLFFLSISL